MSFDHGYFLLAKLSTSSTFLYKLDAYSHINGENKRSECLSDLNWIHFCKFWQVETNLNLKFKKLKDVTNYY